MLHIRSLNKAYISVPIYKHLFLRPKPNSLLMKPIELFIWIFYQDSFIILWESLISDVKENGLGKILVLPPDLGSSSKCSGFITDLYSSLPPSFIVICRISITNKKTVRCSSFVVSFTDHFTLHSGGGAATRRQRSDEIQRSAQEARWQRTIDTGNVCWCTPTLTQKFGILKLK